MLSTRTKPADQQHAIVDSGTLTTVTTVTAVTAITNALPAGTNVVGKFTTDQTTHGTTDLIASDLTKVAGTAVVTGGVVGSQGVGGLAAAGAAVAGNPNLVAGKDGSGNAQSIATDTSGNQIAVGNVASGATDSGNPVKIGGKASSTLPTALTTGQRTDLWAGLNGQLIIGCAITGQADAHSSVAGLYGPGGAGTAFVLQTAGSLYNGTSYDRQRNNNEPSVLASAARTTSANSADLVNYNARGVRLFLDVSAQSGTTPTLDVKVQVKDSVSGLYVDLPGAAFAQNIGTVQTKILDIYPGLAAATGAAVNEMLSRTWRVVATIGGVTPSFTFSVSSAYIL
jgi:hypothetical protein